jgi:squalene synthase HpnC
MPKQSAAGGLALAAADAYCRALTRGHYENFTVASRFVDSGLQRDLSRIYAFCRTTDDIGDEGSPSTAVARLDRWRAETEGLFAGLEPSHPALVALAATVARHRMPAQPFLDLIAANVQDQRVHAYATWADLERYCMLSAAPVGRMVLRVFGVADQHAERLSDDVCVGLQLANHAQDVSRDVVIGRTYLVQSDIVELGRAGAVRSMVARARGLLASGRELEQMVPRPLRLQLSLYRLGGFAICDAIEAIGYDTEHTRPHVSSGAKASLAVRAIAEALVPAIPFERRRTIP